MRKTLTFLIIITSHLLQAQQKEFVFTKITKQFGLASSKVNSILKDHRGFYWIASDNGLQRFDSRSMLNFRHDPADSTSLPDNNVMTLFMDRQNRLWLNSGGKPCIYEPFTQKFIRIPIDYRKQTLGISFFFQDSKGLIWMGAGNDNLFVFDSVQNIFRMYTCVLPPFDGIIHKITDDNVRNYYWLSTDKGLAVYDTKTKQYHIAGRNTLPLHSLQYPLFAISGPDFYKDFNNILWIQAWQPPLGFIHFRYDIAKDELTPLNLGNTRLLGWMTDASGTTWAHGTLLARYNNSTKTMEYIPAKRNSRYGIDYNDINHISQDNEGNIWLATNLGLYYLNPQQQYFSTVSAGFTNLLAQPTDANTNAFIETNDGHVIAIRWGGMGLSFFDSTLNEVPSQYGFDARTIKDPNYLMAWCGLQDSKGIIWIGAQHGRIIQLNPVTKKTTTLHASEFEDFTIRSITEDKNGNMWFGTQISTIVKWNRASNSFKKINPSANGKINLGWVLDIIPGNNNDLWISSNEGGLLHIDGNTDQVIKHYLPGKDDQHSLSSATIRDMIRLDGNTLALATPRSLDLLDLRTNTFSHITEKDGLHPDGIISMIMDDAKNIWFSSVDGISKFNLSDKHVKSFGTGEGITEQDFQYNAVTKLRNGRIIFGNTRGFVSFNPASIRETGIPADVQITGFRIFNQNLSVDSLFRNGNKIHLKHSQNYFAIQFASLSHVMSNHPVYYYKLEGVDKDWILSASQEAIYTYLPGGKYTFKVKCISPDGRESNNITSFFIQIQPPFYLRAWFILLSIAIIGGIIYYIYFLQTKRRKEREIIRNRIARDLHDDMGSTLSTINILSSMARSKLHTDEVRASEFINKISDNSQRMMEAMDDIVWAIKPDNDSMQKITARMREFATNVLEAKDIELDFRITGNMNEIKLNMEQRRDFFLVFKEAVNNIAKYSRCKKTTIRVGFLKKRMVLMIQDDGIGFDVSMADDGNGLGNMQKRAYALRGRLQVQSKPGEGTQVILNIPVS